MSNYVDPHRVMKAIRTGQAAGGMAGGAFGAYQGSKKTFKDRQGETHTRTTGQRIGHGLAGGLGYGYLGASVGGLAGGAGSIGRQGGFRPGADFSGFTGAGTGAAGGYEGYARRHGGVPPGKAAPKKPDWLKGAKNKAEGRRAYHAASRKAHPDLGGSEAAQKEINDAWGHWEGQFKEAMYSAFADELEKIAKGL